MLRTQGIFQDDEFQKAISMTFPRRSSLPSKNNTLKNNQPKESEVFTTDISVAQVFNDGLEGMLESTFPLFYFLGFCLEELTAENLLFVIECKDLLGIAEDDDEEFKRKCQIVYSDYFLDDSLLELNLTYKTKQSTLEAINCGDRQAFNTSINETKDLLKHSYSKFLKSKIFKTMIDDLGGHSTKRLFRHVKKTSEWMEGMFSTQLTDERTMYLIKKARKFLWVSLGLAQRQ